ATAPHPFPGLLPAPLHLSSCWIVLGQLVKPLAELVVGLVLSLQSELDESLRELLGGVEALDDLGGHEPVGEGVGRPRSARGPQTERGEFVGAQLPHLRVVVELVVDSEPGHRAPARGPAGGRAWGALSYRTGASSHCAVGGGCRRARGVGFTRARRPSERGGG